MMKNFQNFKTRQFLFIFFFIVASLVLAQKANAATEFVTTVNTDGGGDYSSLSLWEAAINTDIATSTTKVIGGSLTRGSFADNVAVTQTYTSSTAAMLHDTATQIMLISITGAPNATSTWFPTANGNDTTNAWTPTDAGDSIIVKVSASGATADTASATIDGWTTSVTNYISITGNHLSAKYDASKYHITGGFSLNIYEGDVIVKGIGFKFSTGVPIFIYGTGVNSAVTLDSIYAENTSANANQVYDIYNLGAGASINIYNSVGVKYHTSIASAEPVFKLNSTVPMNIFNNTAYHGSGYGFRYNTANAVFKNNISIKFGSNSDSDYDSYSNGGNITNLSSDATSPTVALINKTVSFLDKDNSDFHLVSMDTDAIDAGTNLSGTLTADIDADSRPQGSAWDIGADERMVKIRMRGNVKMRGNIKFR